MVLEGTEYAFAPEVDGLDEGMLHFTATNLPPWASLDPETGTLSGTPGPEHVGVHAGITITASDGRNTVSLPAFSVDVVLTAPGSISVSWTPPTERTDGTPLVDLAGYTIYWGPEEGHYPNVATIDNPGITSFVIEPLVPGTYFVAATAFDSGGLESMMSDAAEATVQ